MSEYKVINEFTTIDGIKMVIVRFNQTGCCSIMEEWEFDRMMLGDMAHAKRNKKSA